MHVALDADEPVEGEVITLDENEDGEGEEEEVITLDGADQGGEAQSEGENLLFLGL